MAADNPSTILLKGDPVRKERDAAAAITPGHLLQLNSTNKVAVHASAGANALRWFAFENDIAGDGISDAYAADEVVQILSCRPGDEVYAWLAAGENVTIGTFLESAANGQLKAVDFVGDSPGNENDRGQSIVAVALQALNLSASAAVATRIKVEVV